MSIKSTRAPVRRQAGISLIELVMFIVIVSVGIAGILSVMNVTTRGSVDPLLRKQALAIAEAFLEEVSLLPVTDCDPDGLQANGSCTQTETLGPEAGEERGIGASPFDNVNDYHGLELIGDGTDTDLGNSANVTVPAGYTATVAVAAVANFGQGAIAIPEADALLITVTVTYNNGADNIVLEGFRTRYAPAGTP